MIDREVPEWLTQKKIEFVVDASAARHTTIACGGAVSLLIKPNSVEELQQVVSGLTNRNISYEPLGSGSNVLISDQGITDRVVIQLGKGFRFCTLSWDRANELCIGGSASLPTVAREAASLGYSGLEFAAGIPASIGGAVRMNAGAHGGQIADCLSRIQFCDRDGTVHELNADQFSFGYRTSSLPTGSIVIGATLSLVPSDTDSITRRLQENLAERKKHQPLQFASCGSVFKNPEGQRGSAGALIEAAGLKGATQGAAQISPMHANWIVNPRKKAKAKDVYDLIQLAQRKVLSDTGITLYPEVKCWGVFE